MARSLKVAPQYLSKVRLSLLHNGYPSQKRLAEEVLLSLSTVKNFISGKPVDYENFRELCDRLGLDWQQITALIPVESTPVCIREVSPFIAGTPILQPSHFFGRYRELQRCFSLLKRHPLQNIAITGKRRAGKTSFLHYLANINTTPTEQLRQGQRSDWLADPHRYQWIYVDFQDSRMTSRVGVLSHILKGLGLPLAEPLDLDYFMDVVSANLRSPAIILLDEIGIGLQRCLELDDSFWESLRSLATIHTGGNLAFILSSQESPLELAAKADYGSPFFNIFGYTTALAELTIAEALELIASSPILFAEADVAWILEKSDRHPLLLQILCAERLFTLEIGDKSDLWQQEGLDRIRVFGG